MDPDQTSTPPTTNQPPPTSGKLKPTAILEPIEESISVRVPWYKRFFVSGVRTETIWRLSFVLLLIAGFFIGRAVQLPQTTATHAGNIHARISLKPLQTHLPPDAFVQVWATTDSTLTTGQFEVLFNPAKVIIMAAKPEVSSAIAGGVTITPPSQANTDGKLIIVFSQAPAKNVNAPTGTFELVNITFRVKSKTVNDSTDVVFVPQNTKLYHEATPFVISALSNTTLLLNSKE